MGKDFVYGALYAILLEFIEHVPYNSVDQLTLFGEEDFFFLICQEFFKNMIKRFVIDKFGGIIAVKLLKIEQHFIFDVVHKLVALPQLFKPVFQIRAIASIV